MGQGNKPPAKPGAPQQPVNRTPVKPKPQPAQPAAAPPKVVTPGKPTLAQIMQQRAVVSPYRQILVYGPPRSGKTRFVGTAAFDERTKPVFVLAFEGGFETLEGIPPEDIFVWPVKTWNDFNEAYEFLQAGDHPFKTVAVDSISEVHVFALLNVVDHEVATSPKRDDPLEVQQQDYGKAMVQMRRFMRSIRDLPMHCIFTSLPRTANVPREGQVQLPNLFGAMAEEVVGMVSIATYLVADRVSKPPQPDVLERKLILHSTPGVRAGVRTGFGQQIPMEIKDPSITKLFDVLGVKG